MSQFILPPDFRNLLPPFLACLPIAFASPRPPPALLSLLSPILRQRMQILVDTAASPTDSWLPLLCWDSSQAEKLAGVVEGAAFEIHPVSGEIDFGDVEAIQYKRFDEETLRAKIQIPDLGLNVTYIWCPEDQQSDRSGWLVAEVSPFEKQESKLTGWSPSIIEADETAEKVPADSWQKAVGPVFNTESTSGKGDNGHGAVGNDEEDDDDDEESYWAQYGTTPGRSPSHNRSALDLKSSAGKDRQISTSDAEYYSRYAHVQPQMENDDPSQDRGTLSESTLNGEAMEPLIRQITEADYPRQPALVSDPQEVGANGAVNGRRSSSPSSRSTAVSRLEDSAEAQSASEVAIRQHVSTSIKGLFRLTRAAGLDREEFCDLVRRELETLSLIAEDD